jgi:hypothetical protein
VRLFSAFEKEITAKSSSISANICGYPTPLACFHQLGGDRISSVDGDGVGGRGINFEHSVVSISDRPGSLTHYSARL